MDADFIKIQDSLADKITSKVSSYVDAKIEAPSKQKQNVRHNMANKLTLDLLGAEKAKDTELFTKWFMKIRALVEQPKAELVTRLCKKEKAMSDLRIGYHKEL